MPAKGKTVVKRAFVDPLKNRNIGRRTGIDIKAGKNIRMNEEGFELFDDYWTESDDDSLYLSHTNRSVVNRNNHSLSSNMRGGVQVPLQSMSPFMPSSVENSAPASPKNRHGTNQSDTIGAALNYKGEVLGTITRLNSDSVAQAVKGEEQPCSALLSFRMKKRLRYSEAIRKSSEDARSGEGFAVPRRPERGRRSTKLKVTPQNDKALPTTAGSKGSSQGSCTRSGDAYSENESERSDPSTEKNTRKESMTLRRSSRRSTSIYRDSSSQETLGSQESDDANGGVNVDSEASHTSAKPEPTKSCRKQSVTTRSSRKTRNRCSEIPKEGMTRNVMREDNVDIEAVCAEPMSDVSHNAHSLRKQSVTSRGTHRSKSGSRLETQGSDASTNSSNTVDNEPAESVQCEASQDVDPPKERPVSLSQSPRKPQISSSQELHGSPGSKIGSNADHNEPTESVRNGVSQRVGTPRKPAVVSRNTRKSTSHPGQQSLGSHNSTNSGNTANSESAETESFTSDASKNVDSPRKSPATLRRSPRKSKCSSHDEVLGSAGSMTCGSTSDASKKVYSPRKQSVTLSGSRKSENSCSENASQETQESQQSSKANGNTDVESEAVPIEAELETSETSQHVDSPRKQQVSLRRSPHKPRGMRQHVDSTEETHISRGCGDNEESMLRRQTCKTSSEKQDQLRMTGAREHAVIDSPTTPTRRRRSVSVSPHKHTSGDVCDPRGETSDVDDSGDNGGGDGVNAKRDRCSEVTVDTDDFLSDSSGETQDQWSAQPVSRLIGSVLQVSDCNVESDTGRDGPGVTNGRQSGVDGNADCARNDKISPNDDDDGDKNGTNSEGGDTDGSVINNANAHRSLHKSSSPLVVASENQNQLHDMHAIGFTSEVSARQSNSSNDLSHQETCPANLDAEDADVVPDITLMSECFSSEEDFEIEEPHFRVFGNRKQNSVEKDVALGKPTLAKPRKTTTKNQRSKAKATSGKKTGTYGESAIPSGRDLGDEEGASPQLHGVEEKRSKNARKRITSQTCDSPTETPSAPPNQQIHSLRRKINLSQSQQDSHGGTVGNLSEASVSKPGTTQKKGISFDGLGDIPDDEVSETKCTETSRKKDSLPRCHPKLVAKTGKRSSAEKKNTTDDDSQREEIGKRKVVKQGRKRQCSQEKGKRQGGSSPKKGRIMSTPSVSEELVEPLDLSLGLPRITLSMETSNQDVSLPGTSPSPIKGRIPNVLPGMTPSTPSPVALAKNKRKREAGTRRRKLSRPRKISLASQNKPQVLKKSKQMARLMGEKQRMSVYGLTPVVKSSHPSEACVTPVSVPKSILKKTVRYSSSTPVHYFNTTKSAVTPVVVPSQPSKNVKIIIPDDNDKDGVRRSQRTRVLPLDWFRNERILYHPRKSGGFVVAGIVSPQVPQVKQENKKKRWKGSPKTARARHPTPVTPHNLSIHQPIPDDCNLVTSTNIPVIDPTTDAEVLVECVKSKDAFNFCGSTGKAPCANDPLILCKVLNQKAFSVGQLVLRPLQEKGTHFVRRDTMVFIIKHGKLAVTIHETTSVLETDDVFFVPQGNTYNLRNLRNEEAKVWFFQLKQ